MNSKAQIYTDGACSGNPGPGGWAAIVIDANRQHVLKGKEKLTTNNKMELKAFIEAIKFCKGNYDSLEIYSDSKYLADGIKHWLPNWKKGKWKTSNNKPVKNLEYWQETDKIILHICGLFHSFDFIITTNQFVSIEPKEQLKLYSQNY